MVEICGRMVSKFWMRGLFNSSRCELMLASGLLLSPFSGVWLLFGGGAVAQVLLSLGLVGLLTGLFWRGLLQALVVGTGAGVNFLFSFGGWVLAGVITAFFAFSTSGLSGHMA